MVSSSATAEDLVASYDQNGSSKDIGITRSIASWVSIIASLLLVWIACRSHIGLSSTFHRILLGICLSDMLFSMAGAHFNYLAPIDSGYMVWNAHGSVRTCDATGFLAALGFFGSLLYTSSLNLHCLVVVTFNKSDDYIRNKIEPWLLAVPVTISVAFSTIFLFGENYNDDNTGVCWVVYGGAPHCDGYGVGQTRDGFEIPCGRGNNTKWLVLPVAIASFVLVGGLIPVTLAMIYATVRKQESKYGGEDQVEGTVKESDASAMSWAVLNRAIGYSCSYLLLFGYNAVQAALSTLGDMQYPFAHPLWLVLLGNIISGMLGVFHLIIYMHARVIFVIESRNCNLFQAIWGAICWRGPASNKSLLEVELANHFSNPNGVSPYAKVEVVDRSIAPNQMSLGAEVESADCLSTPNPFFEQSAEVQQQPQADLQHESTGQEAASAVFQEIPVASPLPEHKSTGEEEEGTGERADANENSSCSLPNRIMQQVLSMGIVQATLIRHEAPKRRYGSSERCHLLQQMSSTGLLYKGETSIV